MILYGTWTRLKYLRKVQIKIDYARDSLNRNSCDVCQQRVLRSRQNKKSENGAAIPMRRGII